MPEVFDAISRVKAECNKVSTMSLFQPVTKSMRLEEFEQAQSQATAQVNFILGSGDQDPVNPYTLKGCLWWFLDIMGKRMIFCNSEGSNWERDLSQSVNNIVCEDICI